MYLTQFASLRKKNTSFSRAYAFTSAEIRASDITSISICAKTLDDRDNRGRSRHRDKSTARTSEDNYAYR